MIGVYKKKKQHLPTIRHIADDQWNEVKNTLRAERPIETIGRSVVPSRKILDGVLYNRNKVMCWQTRKVFLRYLL